MNQDNKCVIIIDENLPLGVAANAAAILGITLGKELPETVGPDVFDQTGNCHLGIIEFPVPILKGSRDTINSVRERLFGEEYSDVTVVDFSETAQSCKTYSEYIDKMRETPGTALNYLALAICGSKKKVNKLTGSMPLLR